MKISKSLFILLLPLLLTCSGCTGSDKAMLFHAGVGQRSSLLDIQAVFDAGISRFRAIVLTTITTVLGLYPLVLETSFQAQFLKPMAISLAYGVMFGTFFILVFFPALILGLNELKVHE